MYRIPIDLDLSFCVGASLNQIAVGKFDVQFIFDSGARIALQSEAEVIESEEVVAHWSEEGGWSSIAFHSLLNSDVIRGLVPNETTIELHFSNGQLLRLYDNSNQFESMQIYRPGQDSIVI